MHAVFGANGRAGGETARALIGMGEPVRVVLRRAEQGEVWRGSGAEVAVASLDDVDAVSAALDGATAAFLLNPPPLSGDPYAQAAAIAAVLAASMRRSNLPKAVILSSIGAQHASGTGVIGTLNQIEAALADAAPSVAFLRPGYFAETWEEVAGPAITAGVLPSFLEPEQKIPMVSTMDVGQAAARLLRQDWTGRRIVELSGPEDWSAAEVAASFSVVLGRPVQPLFVPPAERAGALAEAGIPGEVAEALLGMYAAIGTGRVAREDGNEHWRGTVPLATAIERIVARSRIAAPV